MASTNERDKGLPQSMRDAPLGCRSLVRGVQMNGTGVPYAGPSVQGVIHSDAVPVDALVVPLAKM